MKTWQLLLIPGCIYAAPNTSEHGRVHLSFVLWGVALIVWPVGVVP